MRRLLSIILVAAAAGSVLFARPGAQVPRAQQPSGQQLPSESESETKLIDLKSDISGPVAPGDSVIFLVGNFAAQHNGAVIMCDSAVRYSDKRIEFFGNVLINKNTTYIYGDRADYNGELNEARVYSDLVKVVDEDATLYTYKFVFNTKTNIGEFADGGVMTNRESRLEAVRGYYYGDAKELICVDEVQMRNEEYELMGDSVVYNMQTDNAWFFERTNIWSSDGDYLYADRGAYRKADSLYIVTRNGYVLTEKQEMWSDSIDFYRMQNHVILRSDIQIDDTEHKVLAFGDYGEYWKEPGNAFLTRRPSVVSYDLSQGDSLFMRADSMYLFTIFPRDDQPALGADSVAVVKADSVSGIDSVSLSDRRSGQEADLPGDPVLRGSRADSLVVTDSLQRREVADSLATGAVNAADTVQLTPQQQKERLKEAARKAKADQKKIAEKLKKEKLAEIAATRQQKTTAKLLAQKERMDTRLAAAKLKAESKLKARRARAVRKGRPFVADSAELHKIDSLVAVNMSEMDSLLQNMIDSLALDSLPTVDSLDSLPAADTMYRLMKGFRNVKIYRSDFQSVCDSMTAISIDSTLHLYIKPVLWNQSNQITSEVMDIFTKNQQLVRAEFVGSPMMVSELDTLHYNQVAGKEMTAYFRNNEIYRNDVNGNAQTIYYMQEGEPPVITMMGVIESGGITFYIEQKTIEKITYRNEPVYTFYPIQKIPLEQDLFLKGFQWEGARRPTQAEVFDRRIRPSLREEKQRLRHPDFPIMLRIGDYKKRLIEQRRWSDRNDKVDQPTVEWMRELGFEVGQPRPPQKE